MDETEQAGDDGGLVLYQWPSTEHCDSIYVRCTKIQRLLGLLKIPFAVADVSLPTMHSEAEISVKVRPMMQRIPIIRIGADKYVEETAAIIRFLVERAAFRGFDFADASSRARAFFLEQWIERWLVWKVIYGRFYRDKNFAAFQATMNFKDNRKVARSLEYMRKRAIANLMVTEVGKLAEANYLRELEQGFQMLEVLLAGGPFLTGSTLRECDLGLFMCVQAFLDPALADESERAHRFPFLLKWFERVDTETKTPYSRPRRPRSPEVARETASSD